MNKFTMITVMWVSLAVSSYFAHSNIDMTCFIIASITTIVVGGSHE